MYSRLIPCLLLLPFTLQAQVPDPRDLLAQSAAEVFSAKTVRIAGTLVVVGEVKGNPQATETKFALEFEQGGRVRRETTIGGQTVVQIFDGTDTWTYQPANQTYTRATATRRPEITELRSLSYGRDVGNVLSATVDRTEAMPFDGRQVACYVINAAYKGTPNGGGVSGVKRTVWIAQEGGKVLRDVWEIPWSLPTGPSVATATTTYTTVETGTALANDRFTFSPPENSKPASKSMQPTIAGGSGALSNGTGNGVGVAAPGSGSGVPPIVPVRKVDPEYPETARGAGLQGTVFVTAVIKDGRVKSASVKRGLGMGTDAAALSAVRQWQYPPGTNLETTLEVQFRLNPPNWWFVADSQWSVDGPINGSVVKPRFSAYQAMADSECTGDSASVAVSLKIAKDGSSDHPGWRFEPATVDGNRRASSGIVLMECRIPGESAPASGAEPVLRVGSGVSAPVAIFRPEPEYSEEARRAKQQGAAVLAVVIDARGKVSRVQVVRPLGLGLDEKAAENLLRWRFKPAMREGKAVAVSAQITVDFRLL